MSMAFPDTRLRRLRASAHLRGLVRETELSAARFVLPLLPGSAEFFGGDPVGPRVGR